MNKAFRSSALRSTVERLAAAIGKDHLPNLALLALDHQLKDEDTDDLTAENFPGVQALELRGGYRDAGVLERLTATDLGRRLSSLMMASPLPGFGRSLAALTKIKVLGLWLTDERPLIEEPLPLALDELRLVYRYRPAGTDLSGIASARAVTLLFEQGVLPSYSLQLPMGVTSLSLSQPREKTAALTCQAKRLGLPASLQTLRLGGVTLTELRGQRWPGVSTLVVERNATALENLAPVCPELRELILEWPFPQGGLIPLLKAHPVEKLEITGDEAFPRSFAEQLARARLVKRLEVTVQHQTPFLVARLVNGAWKEESLR